MAPDRTRFTHTDVTQIGGLFLGTIDRALAGETFTETYTGTLGPSVRAVAPIRDAGGQRSSRWSAWASPRTPSTPSSSRSCRSC